MEKQIIPDLVFVYPDNFPNEIIQKEKDAVATNNLNLKIQKVEKDIFMAFEWVVPTVFGIYILKPYFDSFLKEAGKDHYLLLKNGMKRMIEKGKLIKGHFVTASQSSDKLSNSYSQSIVVSIELQTKANKHLKLLFDNSLDMADWEDAIDQLLDMVVENYESYPNDTLSKRLAEAIDDSRGTIYGVINPDTKKVDFFDDMMLYKKYK